MKRVLALVLLAACASNPELPKSAGGTVADSAQIKVLMDRADALYKGGKGLADVEAIMAAYEEVLKVAPDYKDALLRASQMHYYHGALVIPLDDKEKRLASHLKGREQGLRAMATNAKWREAYEKDNDIVKQMPLLGVDDIPAAYWAALNWAKWGELYGILRAAIDIPKVKALMEHVIKVAPAFDGNAGDRFFIGYWVVIPGFAGKDPKKSRAAYDKAVKESPACLSNHITLAQYYAKDVEDRALFDQMLKKVNDAPETPVDSPYRWLNTVAKEEAKGLAARAKEMFE